MKNIFYSFVLVSIILSLTACTKDTQNKLVGEWKTIPVYDLTDPQNETWEFTSDGKLLVRHNSILVSEGNYKVNATFLDTKLIVDTMTHNFNYYQATWTIIQLNRKTLYINNDKDGGLYTKEFEHL